MVRKTKEEAQLTRDRILDAAECVFQQRGVAQTSLAEVASTAGVTRGAVYWHFENKADLFEAMMQRTIGPTEDELNTLLERHGDDALEGVRMLLLDFFSRTATDARFRRVFEIAWHKCEYTGEMAKIRDNHLECGANYLSIIEEAMRRAQRLGQLPAELDTHIAAVGLMSVVDGMLVNWTLDPNRFDFGKTAPHGLKLYFARLTAGKTAST